MSDGAARRKSDLERDAEPNVERKAFDPRAQDARTNRAVAIVTLALFAALSASVGNYARFSEGGVNASAKGVVDATSERLTAAESERDGGDATNASPEKLSLRVDLNAATKAELTTLPRIGEALAARIIEYRESVGGFSEVDDLLNVKGIGPKKLESARPYCFVGCDEEE